MVLISGFSAYTVSQQHANDVTTSENDGLKSSRIKESEIHPHSFLRVTSPAIFQTPSLTAPFDQSNTSALRSSKEKLNNLINDHVFLHEPKRLVYLYRSLYKGHEQVGIVCGVDVGEYQQGKVVPHENTFQSKVESIIDMVKYTGVSLGFPLTFANFSESLKLTLRNIMANTPALVDVEKDAVHHSIFRVNEMQTEEIINDVKNISHIFIADGHHRFESYAQMSEEHRSELMFIPIILFPSDTTKILKFNRIVMEVDKLSDEAIINRLKTDFEIMPMDISSLDKNSLFYAKHFDELLNPTKKGEFMFYFTESDAWYKINVKQKQFKNPLEVLDVWQLSYHLFDQILGMEDLRNEKNIKCITELQGDAYFLQTLCQSQGYRIAIICKEGCVEEVENVARAKLHMPPKSTLFYPKPLLGMLFKPITFEHNN